MSEDCHRFVSLDDAAARLGIRRAEALDYLRRSGVVRCICGRRKVWLPDLAELGREDEQKPKAKPRQTTKSGVLKSYGDMMSELGYVD